MPLILGAWCNGIYRSLFFAEEVQRDLIQFALLRPFSSRVVNFYRPEGR